MRRPPIDYYQDYYDYYDYYDYDYDQVMMIMMMMITLIIKASEMLVAPRISECFGLL